MELVVVFSMVESECDIDTQSQTERNPSVHAQYTFHGEERWLYAQMSRLKTKIFPLYKKSNSGDIWAASLFAQAKSEDVCISTMIMSRQIDSLAESLALVKKDAQAIRKNLGGIDSP